MRHAYDDTGGDSTGMCSVHGTVLGQVLTSEIPPSWNNYKAVLCLRAQPGVVLVLEWCITMITCCCCMDKDARVVHHT